MKKGIILGAVAILFLGACKKETAGSKGLLSMKVDGTAWTATNEVGAFITSADKFVCDGSVNVEVLTFGVTNVTGLGTFPIVGSGSLLSYDVAGSQDYLIADYVANSHGTITITALNANNGVGTSVTGTFEGVAYNGSGDSVIITNGKFEDRD